MLSLYFKGDWPVIRLRHRPFDIITNASSLHCTYMKSDETLQKIVRMILKATLMSAVEILWALPQLLPVYMKVLSAQGNRSDELLLKLCTRSPLGNQKILPRWSIKFNLNRIVILWSESSSQMINPIMSVKSTGGRTLACRGTLDGHSSESVQCSNPCLTWAMNTPITQQCCALDFLNIPMILWFFEYSNEKFDWELFECPSD